MKKYVMYGAQVSLYSGKLRCYLQHKGLPFEEKLSTASRYKRFIIPKTGVRFIPVLQTPEGEVLQDTTVIIDELEHRHPENPAVPQTSKQRLAALILELFGDEWLLLPAMHYRWNYPENHPFLHREMGQMLFPWLPGFLQKPMGRKIGGRLNAFLPPLGITEKTQPAIEQWYSELLQELGAHFEQYPFLLGHRPTIADYGFIGPFYAHLYRDPAPGRMMRERAPQVAAWVERMINETPARDSLIADDEIPDTLIPILKRFSRDQLPVIREVAAMLHQWHQKNPDSHLPRFIGHHSFSLGGVEEKRAAIVYPIWMYQRCLDHFNQLDGQDKAQAENLLQSIDALDDFRQPLPTRVERRNNRLCICQKIPT